MMSSPRQVLLPLILASNVLGTLPYTRNLKFSKLLLLYCIFINTVPCVYILDSAIEVLYNIKHLPPNDIMLQVGRIICSVSSIANLYFLFRQRTKFVLIVSNFEEIHRVLGNCSGETRSHVKIIIFVLCIASWVIQFSRIAIQSQKLNTSRLISNLIYRLIGSSLHSLGTQFLSFCILTKFYLQLINDKLAKLQKERNKNEIACKQIEELRRAHNKLCENAHLINEVYGIYLLLPLSYISIYLQADVFHIIKIMIDYATEFLYVPLNDFDLIVFILWAINDFTKTGTYFRIANILQTEVKRYIIFIAQNSAPLNF